MTFITNHSIKQFDAATSQDLKNLLLQFNFIIIVCDIIIVMSRTHESASINSILKKQRSKRSNEVTCENHDSTDVRIVRAAIDEQSISKIVHLREQHTISLEYETLHFRLYVIANIEIREEERDFCFSHVDCEERCDYQR